MEPVNIFANLRRFEILKTLGIELDLSLIRSCKVAINDQLECLGQITVPITLQNETYIFDF